MSYVGARRFLLALSAVLMLGSIVVLTTIGFNWGVDFVGGALLERAFPGQVTPAQIRDILSGEALAEYDLGGSVVQPLEESNPDQTVMLIRTRAVEGSEAIDAVDQAFKDVFGEGVVVRRTELVGPVIGQELVRQALWALALSALAIIIYIAFRFEYRFGVASLYSTLHVILVTLAAVALLRIEINTPFVAAILTVVAYSINDTIVVFDRIRENLGFRRRESVAELVEASIRQTIVRCINTSFSTMLVVAVLFLFGGSTIKDFALTLLIGIGVGVYSSIFVASQAWLVWRELEGTRVQKAA